MGMGNLEGVIEALRRRPALLRRAVLRLHADAPHRRPTQRLASFGDDSSNYYWKLGAAREIMRTCAPTSPAERRRAADRRRLGPPLLLDGAPQGDCARCRRDAADTALDARAGVGCGRRRSASRSTSAAEVRAISDAPALRVTGADDGGWTFRVSRTYASERAGARVPVRSGPPAGSQRDRLVALGALDPRHRVARREGARAAARPAGGQ